MSYHKLMMEKDVYKRQVLYGELAQLGEHLPCTQGVKGSSPLFSTIHDSLP